MELLKEDLGVDFGLNSIVLPNIFQDNKVSISESNIPLRVFFAAVCRINGVLLISAFNKNLEVDFGFYSVG